MQSIPIEISARHLHITASHFEKLFGVGISLTVLRNLSQPNQFAANEVVDIVGPAGEIKNVRIVGPFRDQTQVELAVSDCRKLGIEPHFAVSGDLKESSGGVMLVGPAGKMELSAGIIVALAHIHMSPRQAQEFNFKHLDKVTVHVDTPNRAISFRNVVIRTREGIDELAFHIDTDEANAVGDIKNATVILEH